MPWLHSANKTVLYMVHPWCTQSFTIGRSRVLPQVNLDYVLVVVMDAISCHDNMTERARNVLPDSSEPSIGCGIASLESPPSIGHTLEPYAKGIFEKKLAETFGLELAASERQRRLT